MSDHVKRREKQWRQGTPADACKQEEMIPKEIEHSSLTLQKGLFRMMANEVIIGLGDWGEDGS